MLVGIIMNKGKLHHQSKRQDNERAAIAKDIPKKFGVFSFNVTFSSRLGIILTLWRKGAA